MLSMTVSGGIAIVLWMQCGIDMNRPFKEKTEHSMEEGPFPQMKKEEKS